MKNLTIFSFLCANLISMKIQAQKLEVKILSSKQNSGFFSRYLCRESINKFEFHLGIEASETTTFVWFAREWPTTLKLGCSCHELPGMVWEYRQIKRSSEKGIFNKSKTLSIIRFSKFQIISQHVLPFNQIAGFS